jgi:hypothetical protein
MGVRGVSLTSPNSPFGIPSKLNIYLFRLLAHHLVNRNYRLNRSTSHTYLPRYHSLHPLLTLILDYLNHLHSSLLHLSNPHHRDIPTTMSLPFHHIVRENMDGRRGAKQVRGLRLKEDCLVIMGVEAGNGSEVGLLNGVWGKVWMVEEGRA